MNRENIQFDESLLQKYSKSGPRYTSYPTAVEFSAEFTLSDYQQQVALSNRSGAPLSLYFHIPFCDTVCFYCGCNKVVTKDRSKAAPYLERLYRELALQSEQFDRQRLVTQLHWGGGTPTFISHSEMSQLMAQTRQNFTLLDNDEGEYSIEIDPREVSHESIKLLRSLGFNRMSLGVQDIAPQVQQAVNRIQPADMTRRTLDWARDEGFKSISLDLIYGLPFQSVASFSRTLDEVIDIGPDRLAVFNYAHLPDLFKPQRRINEADLPQPQQKLEILQLTIDKLTDAGYLYIGMDHFARPDDELATAQREGKLYRNFQGYSTHADCDLIGIGVTSISQVHHSYSQNIKQSDDYYAALDQGRLPLLRGIALTEEDRLRCHVITQLICHFQLQKGAVNQLFKIDFNQHFATELAALSEMEQDGLLRLEAEQIVVEPRGKLLIRNICMVFDAYLQQKSGQRFSKVI
ncbi:oxygen-independent coproporphyrinogen III oxidase [Ectothiorhodospiraceae bacterium BW-2]|nr:oxygen-independent coproporphyrinogen III oxidase [Ectothiorhodospiraceae bacterium BW-2]